MPLAQLTSRWSHVAGGRQRTPYGADAYSDGHYPRRRAQVASFLLLCTERRLWIPARLGDQLYGLVKP